MSEKWYEKSYRRNFLDMHVPDWNEQFLSEFNVESFLDTLALSRGTSITFFANAHTGLNYWPSKVGQMHRLLKGRDLLGEMIAAGHRRGLDVIVYYCTIYVNWYPDTHPEARITDVTGYDGHIDVRNPGRSKRRGLVCPNNEGYRQFVVTQLEELCTGYEFEGVWPDMTFWPTVCYCSACRERYHREVGGEMPRIINWEDPVWVRFQRKRQEWIREFAALVTDTIKRHKPAASVAHQSHTYSDDWLFAPSAEMARHTDWLSADLYRDKKDMSFLCKLFYDLSEIKPFEQVNCWYYPTIHEHVLARTEEHLRCTTFNALMNHGAQVYIDAVDPVGTVNPANYERAGKVYGEMAKYEPYAGGRFCRDIGIYLSFDSLFDLGENGRPVQSVAYNFVEEKPQAGPMAHGQAALGMTRTLLQNHLPYGVVTRKDLSRLSDFQAIVLPNLVMLSEEEMAALRDYVKAGGSLYASKDTSIVSHEGNRQPDFQLADVFGVSYRGTTEELVTYVTPTDTWRELFPGFTSTYPVTLSYPQQLVELHGGAEVLATITLPYTGPTETRYASHLTDPPGCPTDHPSLVLHPYGKGKVLYSAGVIETWEHETQRTVSGNLLRLLLTRPPCFETDAPAAVELTLFDQKDAGRSILHLLNFQDQLPNIPIFDLQVKVRLDGRKVKRIARLPGGETIEFSQENDRVAFSVPRLDTYGMYAIEY